MFKKLIILLVGLLCTVISLPVTNEDPEVENHSNKLEDDDHLAEFRLSHDTEPRLYKIEFDPDFGGEKFTFKGNGAILFEVLKPTTSVTLHRSRKIVIDEDSTEVVDEKGILHQPLKQEWNPDNDFHTIQFEKELELGNYTLKIKWVSNDNNNEGFSTDSGFFRMHEDYEDENSDYLIATLFEPISARTAFPCWDEPGFKAQFELSIKHFPNYTALSNMPEKSRQQLSDGRILTQFERSVKMSSYNLCIIVANCKSVKSSDRNISFYGLNNDIENLQLPLKISESVVKILEDYTGIPYALPKLDHFAIPEGMPAMENWGLITYPSMSVMYRNTTLIPDVEHHDGVAFLVAHEVSHQWFGNLVTSVWWDDLWLNEAFATYFSFIAMDEIDKDRPVMEYFSVQNNNDVIDLEFPPYSGTTIKWKPSDKEDTIAMFSSGTYYKGASVIQMLESILSENVFRDGIRRYLKAHQFSAVTADNLWEGLQEAYNEAYNGENSLNIKEIMDPWILQKGIPVLTVTRNYETGETNITQENSLGNKSDTKWNIPLNYATESNPDFSSPLPTLWMNKDQKTITLPSINKDDWIIVNIQQKGIYKVNYDRANWNRLTKYLINNHEKIHPANRAQLIMSAMSLVKEDPSNIDIIFKLVLYLHREKDYVPWMSIAQLLLSLSEEFRKNDYENLFIDLIRYLTDAIGKSDMFHKENLESVRIRRVLAPLLCDVNNTNCLSYAHKLFDQFINNPSDNAFPESDWYWVICTGLKEVNDSVWERFTSDKDPLTNFIPGSTHRIIKCTNDFEKRDKYLMKLLKSESKLLTSFVDEVITDFLDSNRQDVNYIMDYIGNHFEDIERFYNKSDSSKLQKIIKQMFSSVQNQDQLEKMKILVATHKDKLNVIFSETSPSIDQLLEAKEQAIETPADFLPKFKELFDQFVTREADGNLKLKNI